MTQGRSSIASPISLSALFPEVLFPEATPLPSGPTHSVTPKTRIMCVRTVLHQNGHSFPEGPRYPLQPSAMIAPEILLAIRMRPALPKRIHGGFVPSDHVFTYERRRVHLEPGEQNDLPCLKFSRRSYGCDAGVLDTHLSYYPLMCQFPSENAPNSCNIPPRGFHFPSSPVLESISLNRIEFSQTISGPLFFRLGRSSLSHLIPRGEWKGVSCFDIQNSILLLPSHLNSSDFYRGLTPFHFVFAPASQGFPSLGSWPTRPTNQNVQSSGSDWGIGYCLSMPGPLVIYDFYNGIRQSRNAAGNERPTICPAAVPPRKAIRRDPFHFYPVSSSGSPLADNAPGMPRQLIDLSVGRAAFTYPPPSLPLVAHTMVHSSSPDGYPICHRNGDPLESADCDPSSLILFLSPRITHTPWRLYDASLQSPVSSMGLSDNPPGIPHLRRPISMTRGCKPGNPTA